MKIEDCLRDIEDQVRRFEHAVLSREECQEIKRRYLGRKGELTLLIQEIGKLPPELKPVIGRKANQLKTKLENLIAGAVKEEPSVQTLKAISYPDLTLPGTWNSVGKVHPIRQIQDWMSAILENLGFQLADGPEIETDYYNFEALNFPKDHPAREMQDTFFIQEDVLLRTQTSPVQIRVMEKYSPPLRIYSPGKVYRRDFDVSHSPMFHQIEGLWVDRGITFGNLKGVLLALVHAMFGSDIPVRFRPSFFPFTEPSAEIDIGCQICKGEGCRVCKNSGWLEILGAGMVHPELFRRVGYDPEEFTGFAFGMGLERIAMLKYGIDDIRLFFENDLRFLTQF